MRVQNIFPEKNNSTLSKQLKNILIEFGISKMFSFVKIKLKVANVKLSTANKNLVAIKKSLNLVKTTEKYSYEISMIKFSIF